MAAELYGLPVGDSGEIDIPDSMDGIIPDVELVELQEVPTAVAYALADDLDGDEYEHRFECPGIRMFGADGPDGQGIVVIVGDFKISRWSGFADTCEDEGEEDGA